MTLFRLALTFSPTAPNPARKNKFGVWRVRHCHPYPIVAQAIFVDEGLLCITVARPINRGAVVSPAKLLREYWQHVRSGEIIYFGKAA